MHSLTFFILFGIQRAFRPVFTRFFRHFDTYDQNVTKNGEKEELKKKKINKSNFDRRMKVK